MGNYCVYVGCVLFLCDVDNWTSNEMPAEQTVHNNKRQREVVSLTKQWKNWWESSVLVQLQQ